MTNIFTVRVFLLPCSWAGLIRMQGLREESGRSFAKLHVNADADASVGRAPGPPVPPAPWLSSSSGRRGRTVNPGGRKWMGRVDSGGTGPPSRRGCTSLGRNPAADAPSRSWRCGSQRCFSPGWRGGQKSYHSLSVLIMEEFCPHL